MHTYKHMHVHRHTSVAPAQEGMRAAEYDGLYTWKFLRAKKQCIFYLNKVSVLH